MSGWHSGGTPFQLHRHSTVTDIHDDSILRLEGISRSFPGVRALDDVSFEICRGEVHALVGENGAGKSTLMHILGGVLQPDRGRIILDGRDCVFHSAHDAQLKGVRVVYQELSIVSTLSVAENIFANCQPVNSFGLIDRRELNRRAKELITAFGEDIEPDILAGELPIGKCQVLEILKALTFSPSIVLLDEPTSSLSASETAMLFNKIRSMKNEGVSFIFISHHMPEIFEIADRVTVLRDGACQGTFEVSETDEDALIAKMVGRKIGDMYGTPIPYSGKQETVIAVENLSRKSEFHDVTFSIERGEILGFAGLVGAGRTELAQSLFGLNKPDQGIVRLPGETVRFRSVKDAVKHGVAYLSEDRKVRGLCLSLSVRENLAAPSLDRFAGAAGFINDRKLADFADETIVAYNITTPSARQTVFNLSGGNQQKVLLGMWMGTSPQILIADEPTRGVDVGAKEEIYRHIRSLATKGAAVMLISSDLNEILGMSDRICVMRNGRIAATLNRDEASEETIISHALARGEAVS